MRNLVILLSFILPVIFGFTSSEVAQKGFVPAPESVTVISKTSTSVSYDWDDCNCSVLHYRVFFEGNGMTSAEIVTKTSDITVGA